MKKAIVVLLICMFAYSSTDKQKKINFNKAFIITILSFLVTSSIIHTLNIQKPNKRINK